jgi:hypothetical protein
MAGHLEERWLRVSTAHLTIADGERTLLCIEDITERRLPPGAPGGRLPPGERYHGRRRSLPSG